MLAQHKPTPPMLGSYQMDGSGHSIAHNHLECEADWFPKEQISTAFSHQPCFLDKTSNETVSYPTTREFGSIPSAGPFTAKDSSSTSHEQQYSTTAKSTGVRANAFMSDSQAALMSPWSQNPHFEAARSMIEPMVHGSRRQGPATSRADFRRSRMALLAEGRTLDFPRASNTKYLGDVTSRSYRSQVTGLPDHLNCALWITGIPAEADYSDVFAVINTGAVFCLHLNDPTDQHSTKAAKLVFKKPEEAARFLYQTRSQAGVSVMGSRIRAIYNRHGHQQQEAYANKTRVLVIAGPVATMSMSFWIDFFKFCTVCQFESALELPSPNPRKRIMQFRFARIDGQAESCYEAIMRDDLCPHIYLTRYGYDPCDPASGGMIV
ncbi:hypothetical protein PVAG01_10005 [Phlyctema vagabunda]|uniref:RRM domain-containing protein n=1 Tax=Phlyctema vagabunda TaxID=108571 RepID=A0ABR4P4Q6_9HELO